MSARWLQTLVHAFFTVSLGGSLSTSLILTLVLQCCRKSVLCLSLNCVPYIVIHWITVKKIRSPGTGDCWSHTNSLAITSGSFQRYDDKKPNAAAHIAFWQQPSSATVFSSFTKPSGYHNIIPSAIWCHPYWNCTQRSLPPCFPLIFSLHCSCPCSVLQPLQYSKSIEQ